MASTYNRHALLNNLPRAGFRWPRGSNLLRHSRQDRIILCALRDRGGANFLMPGARVDVRHVRRQLDDILAGIFDMATADANAGRIDQFASELDWAAELGTRLGWADDLDEDIFLELFVRLRQARREWESNKCEPFDRKDHGALAHALDRFYQATRDSLVENLDELFLMTQEPGVEDSGESVGDDPAVEAPHTQGTGAPATAGEPHQQTPLASDGAGEDEDGDVQMEDGEGDDEGEDDEDGSVREVRHRLAATTIGEEMEVDE